MWATLTKQSTTRELRFERDYPHSIQTVWSALTTPARIADWMCADVEIEPSLGGRYHLRFRNHDHSLTGEITCFEPPYRLEYTWPETAALGQSLVRWELSATDFGCHLVMTHRLTEGSDLPGFGSGWHWHLDALAHAARGIACPWDEAAWRALKLEYDRRLA